MNAKLSKHIFVFISLCILWQLYTLLNNEALFLFSSPIEVAQKVFIDFDLLLGGLLITGTEVLIGYLIGVASAMILLWFFYLLPALEKLSRPYRIILASIPLFVFAPIVVIWLGVGLWMKVALACVGTLMVLLSDIQHGQENINLEVLHLMRLYNASRSFVFREIVIPHTFSRFIHSAKASFLIAITGALIGEFISSQSGLGYYIFKAGSLYDMAGVFAGVTFLIFFIWISGGTASLLYLRNREQAY